MLGASALWMASTNNYLIFVKFSYIFLFPAGMFHTRHPSCMGNLKFPYLVRAVILRILDRPDFHIITVLFIHFDIDPISDLMAHQRFSKRGLDADQTVQRIAPDRSDQTVGLDLVILLKVNLHRIIDPDLIRFG
jgi:hypothetical protein